MKAFGIFEGGGMKGLAHVGALAVAEQYGIKFAGVAGASAGAIVASLIACGYSAAELFNPDQPDDTDVLFGIDPTQFFGYQWGEFKQAVNDLSELAKSGGGFLTSLRAHKYLWKHADLRL